MISFNSFNIRRGNTLRIAIGTTMLALLLAGGADAKFIRDDATGGDCTSFGTWDAITKTCKMTADLTEGIQIESDGITLDGNWHIVKGSNTGSGVFLVGRTGASIKNLNVEYFHFGIHLEDSSNNNLTGNTASNNTHGIVLLSSSNNNNLTDNTANSNIVYGIILDSSSNNTFTSNSMFDNMYNFALDGSSDSHFINYIDTSNVVDGKSIYYVKNEVNKIYDGSTNAGTFYCINCNNVTIKGMTSFTKNVAGVFLWKTQNSKIENIIVTNNSEGIRLKGSNNNNLTGNTLLYNYNGIGLTSSNNNILMGNTVSYADWGIYLQNSSNNNLKDNIVNFNAGDGFVILASSNNNNLIGNNASSNYWIGIILAGDNNNLNGNTVLNNNYGLGMYGISNTIYNNFFNNTNDFHYILSISNIWNMKKLKGTNIIGGPYLGGNFWANPSGTGFSQTCIDKNKDGICDMQYNLDSENIDYLPLSMNYKIKKDKKDKPLR